MNFSFLKDKIVIVTGSSSGIGLETGILALQHGAKVVFAARNLSSLKQLLELKFVTDENYLLQTTDVSIEENCKQLIEDCIAKFGNIDILINNAGVSMRAAFADVDLDVIKKLMDINFWGMVYCTKYALPYLLKSKGVILGVSSVAGFKGLPGRTGYSASKFAMNGFLESLRLELKKKDVGVCIICPGYTSSNIRNTALNSLGKQQGESPLDEGSLMTPQEVAIEIFDTIKKRNSFVVLSILGKATFWLNKFFPNFIDQQTIKKITKETGSPI